MGWAKIASGARISKIRSVRAHTAASRSPVVSAMGYPPGSGQTRNSVRRARPGCDLKCRGSFRTRQSQLDRRPQSDYPRSPVAGGSDALRRGLMTMRYRAYAYTDEADRSRTLEEDVRHGLTASPKSLPPKYFYDTIGAKLFEDITRLPEYYLTRTEAALLEKLAPSSCATSPLETSWSWARDRRRRRAGSSMRGTGSR